MNIFKNFLFPFLILIYSDSFAQTDTEFWFVASEISLSGSNYLDRPIVFRITTQNLPATVNITQPAGTYSQTLTIPANSTYTVDLTDSIDIIENKPPNTILNYGFKIVSTTPITIYYEVVSGGYVSPEYNPEAYILKGKNALGTAFWIPSQNIVPNHHAYNPLPYNSFDIVATENNTTVTITPSNDIVGNLANIPFIITLNAGQTYSARAVSQAAAQHLNGSYVASDKPIAITVTDDLLNNNNFFPGSCADLAGDQIIPLDKVGTEYIAINGQLDGPGDHIFVTATQNGTTIDKDGVTIATINAGQTHSFPIGSNLSTYIETSFPAYVWQLSGAGCEFGATILPHINCTGSSHVSYTRSSNNLLYINVLVENGAQGNFSVNGNTNVIVPAQFSPVPATGGNWLAASILLPMAQYPQNSIITVTNSSANFHLSTIDINIGGTSYAYFSNYSGINVVASVDTPVCLEMDIIQLYASSNSAQSYLWTGPNGFFSSQQNPAILNPTPLNTGIYTVTVDSMSCSGSYSVYVDADNCGCLLSSGYIYNASNANMIDFWSSATPPGGTFSWDFGDGTPVQATPNLFTSHTYPGIGTYDVSLLYTTLNSKMCRDSFKINITDSSNSIRDIQDGSLVKDIYPNPVTSEINIIINKSKEENNEYKISIFDIYGKQILLNDYRIDKNSNVIKIPISNLTNGLYILKITNGNRIANKKMIKI